MKTVAPSTGSWIAKSTDHHHPHTDRRDRNHHLSPDVHPHLPHIRPRSPTSTSLAPIANPSSRNSIYNNAHTGTTSNNKHSSISSAFRNVFARGISRVSSNTSINSAFSTSNSAKSSATHTLPSSSSSSDHIVQHPYAAMVAAPLPVVSSHDIPEEEEECPVCLEPLSFSFRLPGEKPHIVPECGHALHEACFTAVYGPPPGSSRAGNLHRNTNLGVCGVCRRPMKVGDGDSSKSNKLAALTGVGNGSDILFPGRDNSGAVRNHSTHHHHHHGRPPPATISRAYDPNEDDPVEHQHHHHNPPNRAGHHQDQHAHYVVAPSIQVRSEFSSLTRTSDPSQPLTCIVVIELPGKRQNGHVPGSVILDPYIPQRNGHHHNSVTPTQPGYDYNNPRHHQHMSMEQQSISRSRQLSPQPQDHHSFTSHAAPSVAPSISSLDPRREPPPLQDDDSPFSAITEDLRNRIIDWKGHPLSGLGTLQMYDLLSVRRDSLVREFYVYLFKEAIICVVEERKRSLGRLLSSASSAGAFGDGAVGGPSQSSGSTKGVLRLKGRIYIRHIKQVTDTSVSGELSLTIDMEDERLDSFILIFKDRSSLETWKSNIQTLVTMYQHQSVQVSQSSQLQQQQQQQQQQQHFHNQHQHQYQQQQQQQFDRAPDLEEFGGSQKAMRMLSGSTTGTTVSTVDSILNGSSRSTMSSNTSHGSGSIVASRGGIVGGAYANGPLYQKLSKLEEDEESNRYGSPAPAPLVAPHMSAGPSNSLQPLPHPPLDLILVISVPGPNATPSTAALKVRVIRTSLDFLVASMGVKDRLSLVTFEVGVGGKVRKTPFLCLGNPQSRQRLRKFVDEIGRRDDGTPYEDEFLARSSQDEKTDVVTAVNHGLDVVLQRKSRNPLSGMVLVSDAAETTRRAQMDLVLARAEAANVPIHSFGYGRSHDPASLWLMSNHTSGTYTFVKDWYDLRDCLAGCIGGMMSIGISNMKMHVKIVDGQRFRIRKVSGGPTAILSSDGRDVDVEIGEIRYGERKEMLVELELDNSDTVNRQNGQQQHRSNGHRTMNATDQFNQRMGLDAMTLGDFPDLSDGMMDRMIDEVPVFEVDGSFFDPAAAKHVSRLAHPVLLTVTLLPSGGTSSRPRTPANNGASDPVIVRRRMELLAADMITRALVLVSRKNYPQAQKLLGETKRILHTVLQNITSSIPTTRETYVNGFGGAGGNGVNGAGGAGGTTRNRKEALSLAAVRAIQSVLQDMQLLSEALDENVDMFALDQRNFGAQQAMVLRDQKAWSGRSAIERLFWTIDNSIELVARSTDWVARE